MFSFLVAAVLQVGPTSEYRMPSAAARVARDGDVVRIAAGTYNGDVCAWTANNLTIRGAGCDSTVVAADGYSHNLYVGAVKKLVFRSCRSGRANGGHALKSRARETVIEDSVFDDAIAGVSGSKASSYLVDCPNGGRITLRNCRLHQSADADNGTMIAIGEEGAYPETSLVNEGNTFVNDRAAGCVEVRWEKMLRP